ncbi:MAG: hypothetical protein U0401_33495 [Anaerolineae bacterium]
MAGAVGLGSEVAGGGVESVLVGVAVGGTGVGVGVLTTPILTIVRATAVRSPHTIIAGAT